MMVRERRKGGPFLFEEALGFLNNSRTNVIVEIGAIRDGRLVAKAADGHSTVRWAATPHRVYCVDISSKALNITEGLVGMAHNVSYHCEDGLEFLLKFEEQIDLLYVDGPDPDEGGQEFAERIVVNAPMAPDSVILIDDCDFSDHGKGKYAIEAAVGLSYVLEELGRQALLVRRLIK